MLIKPKQERERPSIWIDIPYIACEDLNFFWTLDEVQEFDLLWKEGFSIQYMSDYFGREDTELALLILDRTRKGKIKPRTNGLEGGNEIEGDQLQ